MAGGAAGQWPSKEQDRNRTVLGVDRLVCEGAGGIELGEYIAQAIVGFRLIEGEIVFFERRNDTVSRKHRRALDNGGRADSIDAHFGRQRYGQLADEMAEGSLADVVGFAATLGDDGVGGAGQHNTGINSLLGEDLRSLID